MTEEMIAEECSYYNKDNYPYCCEIWDNECEAQNCYYKQLKRLEQKLEKIKEVISECMEFKFCKNCKFYAECDKTMEEYILKIIGGAEDEQ